MTEFTKDQMEFATKIANIVIGREMHVRQEAEFLKKTWYCGCLEELFTDFMDFVGAVREAEDHIILGR